MGLQQLLELCISLILLHFLGSGRVFCRMFPDQIYDRGYFENGKYSVETALQKLQQAPKWASDWSPDPAATLGQVSGLALDGEGNLLVFHRASNVWDEKTFNFRNVYQDIGDPPIPQATIYKFNDTGDLIDMWGQDLFYMPHGITVDIAGNVWLTDVGLHQVFKFTPQDRTKPALVLGEKFIPGNDESHFCKPSSVAVMATGEFFVADGYCNTRIIKYNAKGQRLLEWGRRNVGGPGYQPDEPYAFNIPHSLALVEDRGIVCVADRENGRVGCFRTDNGTHVASYRSWMFGNTVYSVAYAPVQGGRLYVVNGWGPLNGGVPVRGYVIDFDSGRLLQSFAPGREFRNPHDIAVSPDGSRVYVGELNPYRVTKFIDAAAANASMSVRRAPGLTPKPTATVEMTLTPGQQWPWWRTVAVAAGGTLAATAAFVGVATLRKTRGRKGVPHRRWEYGQGQFKLRRLLERRRFTRVHSEDSDEEPTPMLPPEPPATA